MKHDFDLVSEWHLAAPPEDIWPLLTRAESWPGWWPYVRKVELLEPGDADDRGALRRTVWASRLPYGFTLLTRTRNIEKNRLLVVEAGGDLSGEGCWELAPIPVGTRVRYTWKVQVSGWMRALSFLLFPVFVWNHHAVMRAGAEGMARELGVELIDYRKLD
jgi:uncharacterized protein YndB with AHSA1/START domain